MLSSRKGSHCVIYDRLHDYRIDCQLPEAILKDAANSFGHRVFVYGRIQYYENGRPRRVHVEKFKTFPNPSTLPGIYNVKVILGHPE